MAVLQMQRISICALKKDRKAILEQLQKQGTVEIDIGQRDFEGLQRMDTASRKAVFEKQANLAAAALEVLQKYEPEKVSLFAALEGKTLEDRNIYGQGARFGDYYIAEARQLLDLDRTIMELQAAIGSIKIQIGNLEPWMKLDVPMNCRGTRTTALLLGTFPGARGLEDILRILEGKPEDPPAVHVQIFFQDKDYTYTGILVKKTQKEAVEEAFREEGFAEVHWREDVTPAERKSNLEETIREHEEQIRECENMIRQLAQRRDDLKLMEDYFRIRAQKYQVLGELPQSERAFFITGYVPKRVASRVADKITGTYDAFVELSDPDPEEDPPVLLKNNRFASSAEGVLSAFGLPGRQEIDPTAVMAVFYVFLFGIMLSDAAYGLIVSAACGVLLKKYPGMSENMKKSLSLFFWCGISTLVWGILFGGYFGDVVDVAGKAFFGVTLPEGKSLIPALWFVPLNNPMKMLLYAMLFGIIHLFTGLGMKGYMCLKAGKYMDFLCDVVFWFLLLTGLVILLLPSEIFRSVAQTEILLPEPVMILGKLFAAAGALGILLFSGRAAGNPVLRLALGAYDLYNITGWLSDVLSYSRLLALGLATGVIASVINQMGVLLGPVGFVVVFILGHLMNLAINLLGAYVHTCRLQYVEFFGKFYEGGGREFHPFRADTKYVDIKEETR